MLNLLEASSDSSQPKEESQIEAASHFRAIPMEVKRKTCQMLADIFLADETSQIKHTFRELGGMKTLASVIQVSLRSFSSHMYSGENCFYF